jgi:hypothetical protein
MAGFKIDGQWIAHQSNGFDVRFDLKVTTGQDSNGHVRPLVHGNATQTAQGVGGDVKDGFLSETELNVVVNWQGGARGEYFATFGGDGRLRGLTRDVDHPESQATWFSDRQFQRV